MGYISTRGLERLREASRLHFESKTLSCRRCLKGYAWVLWLARTGSPPSILPVRWMRRDLLAHIDATGREGSGLIVIKAIRANRAEL